MKKVNTPYYYDSPDLYAIPPFPGMEISAEEAEKLTAYWIAFYDDRERIVRWRKILNGDIEVTAYFNYDKTGNVITIRTEWPGQEPTFFQYKISRYRRIMRFFKKLWGRNT